MTDQEPSDEELIDRARSAAHRLSRGEVRKCIPARMDDDDLIVIQLADRLEARNREIVEDTLYRLARNEQHQVTVRLLEEQIAKLKAERLSLLAEVIAEFQRWVIKSDPRHSDDAAAIEAALEYVTEVYEREIRAKYQGEG